MQDEPADLTAAQVAETLRHLWRIEVQTIEYAPVGFGSYHWRIQDTGGQRFFVTGDRLAAMGVLDGANREANAAALNAAYSAAAALREGGLTFVVAPIASAGGAFAERIRPDWVVAVLPHVEGESSPFGAWDGVADGPTAAAAIGSLHSVPPPASLQRWEPAIPNWRDLDEALSDLTQPWTGGPYAERTRLALADARPAIEAQLARYARLTESVASSSQGWVVTHGEPHRANFIRSSDGTLHLIDWDTVRLGPRERDLWIVAGDDSDALAAYCTTAREYSPQPDAMALFELRWPLADVCVYVRRFRQPHGTSDDDEASWQELQHCLAQLSDAP
jgi:spectinomycin phosphotransferase